MAKLMNIGFGNMVNTDKIVSIISSDSAPAKRMISRGKEQEILIDATQGRRTKSVIFTENNKIILSALQPETLAGLMAMHRRVTMIQKSKGILIVLSGFSGSGKGTIMKELMKKYSEQYALSISATTRSPRPGETDGVEYFFRTKEQFEKMIADDELIEYAKYVDNYYGTPKAYVEEQLAAGKDVILEIEIQGALKVKEKFPDTLLMFVTPPSAEELKNRLVGRGTEEMSVIESRLSRAVEEAQGIEAYDYLIVNDKLDACVEEVHSIIHNEHFRVSRNLSAISDMRHQLTAFSKKD